MKTPMNRMAAIGLVLLLSACGGADRPAPQPSAPMTDTRQTEVYYAAREGLALFDQPTFSGRPLARLPLNEKLLRHKVEKGFAFVTVARTGARGWVENAKLGWKQTKRPEAVPAPVSSPKTAAPPPPAVTSPAKGADSAVGKGRSPSKPDASIFDAN